MDAINGRILEKYDRDHRLGHAYFMGIDTLTGLYNTWYYKIIPLLSEYFYNDVSTLTEIVGNSFFDKHGNVKYLSLDRKENGHSEFEEQIRSIYMEKSDG